MFSDGCTRGKYNASDKVILLSMILLTIFTMDEGIRLPPAAPIAKNGFSSLKIIIGEICDGTRRFGSTSPRYPPIVCAYKKPKPGVATFEPIVGPIVCVKQTIIPFLSITVK